MNEQYHREMNPPARILPAIFLLSFVSLFHPLSVLAWSGKVVGIADGDTIKVLYKNEAIRIRLYGIDTPEKRQAFGNKAKKFTNAMVRGKRVDIDPITKDRYGRTVAMVHIHGKSLNQSLIRAGYAWVYPKYCRERICKNWYQDEEQARNAGRGLWRNSDPIPPWKWRKMKRNHE